MKSVTKNDTTRRIDAINYTLAHDDGQTNNGLDQADVILVGVSGSGKTPNISLPGHAVRNQSCKLSFNP